MTTVVGVPARAVKGAPSPGEFAELLRVPTADPRDPMCLTQP